MSEASRPPFLPEPPDSGFLSQHRVKAFIGLIVLLGAFGYFALVAFQSATMFYYTVGELRDIGPTEDNRSVRLSGMLVTDSFHREEGSTFSNFVLTDGDATIQAIHDGVLPDLFFNEHSQIILEGRYKEDGTFHSVDVSVKCPSKYIATSD